MSGVAHPAPAAPDEPSAPNALIASDPFAGPTELHARCRALDWAATPLGPVAGWPTALRVAAQMVLAAGLPAIVLWGAALTQLYNDAYARLIRAKHPYALGRGNEEVWPEVWHLNGPIFARVFAGETVTLEDAPYTLARERAGDAPDDAGVVDRGAAAAGWVLDEAYLTLSYSPIAGDDGRVGGVLVTLVETTGRVRERQLADALRDAARRQAFLARLGDALRPLADPHEVKAVATRLLGEHLGVTHAYYVDVEPDDAHVVCAADYASGAPSLVGRYPMAAFGPTLADEYRAGRTLVIADTHDHPLVPAELSTAWDGIGVRAQVAVPLVRHGRFAAALGVDQAVPRAWTPDEVALVQETAERTWAAVARAHADAALRESEARFRHMADAAPVMLWVTEADGRCTFLNHAWLAFTGQTLDSGLGFGWLDAVHPDDAADAERIFLDATARGVGFRIEYRLRRHDGVYRRAIDAAAPRRGPDGAFRGYVGSVVDVEERAALVDAAHAAQHAAEAAQRVAEAANRAKSEFLAVMSHELRTPLNAIGGYAELIELGIHGPVTDGQRAALARLQQSQRHLLGLINGVLDYSRVEAGAVTYRTAVVPVAEAVAEAEVLVAPQLRARGLRFAWHGAPPGLAVRADREKLQQVLLNLLGNAVKFTHPRDAVPGHIDVTCTAGDGMVRLHVRDTGEGIAADQLERVFEPFVQADQRFTRRADGVGLGLAISRDLARGMGGDLTAESVPGVGSTFTLVLPAADGAALGP